MVERVRELDIGVCWEPNVPEAVLTVDSGRAVLVMNPHFDDADRRLVVLDWKVSVYASMGYPNDEGIHEHRLYDRGLKGVLWSGVVEDSQLVDGLMKHRAKWPEGSTAGVRDLVHYIVLTKEDTIEVVAEGLTVRREHSWVVRRTSGAGEK